MKNPLWIPSRELIENSNIFKFLQFVNQKFNYDFQTYDDLYNWSVSDIEKFWESVLRFSGIVYSSKYSAILANYKKGVVKPGAVWFEGIKLNYAENLLRKNDDSVAIIELTENGFRNQLTFKELYLKVTAFAAGLKKLGVQKSDRVAGFITNSSEAVIAMLATTSIGAIWSSVSPDFGVTGVLSRFQQIQPKVLIAVDSYSYMGNLYSTNETLKELEKNLPDNPEIIVISNNNQSLIPLKKFKFWNEVFDDKAVTIHFEQVEFDHPVFIMYSSGTTGKPKCIVHGTGGTLLQHYKEHALHTNLKENDRIMYFTTCGWMMWNWLVSSLQVGAAIVLYDGSPVFPSIETLWKIIEDYKINVFGTSPKFISTCRQANFIPNKNFHLTDLRTVLSTGAPLPESSFEWVYDNVKNDVMLSSISGGTDIISCFMLGNPMLPVFKGEIQSIGLGMKVEAWKSEANPVINEKGELVCTEIFPSMPVYFWNDPYGKLYHSAYFNHFPNVWRHGDFIEITENRGVIVYGRSDSTLNPSGIRIGTAEIYRALESIDEVSDSLVVSKKIDEDEVIVLFVTLNSNFVLDRILKNRIKSYIKTHLSPRHVPKFIFQISEIPVTLNGKKVEKSVSNILNGIDVDNKEALANPDSLNQFYNLDFSADN